MHDNHTPRTPRGKRPRLPHHRRDPRRHARRVLVLRRARGRVVDGLDRGGALAGEGPEDQVDERPGGAELGRRGRLARGKDLDLRAV